MDQDENMKQNNLHNSNIQGIYDEFNIKMNEKDNTKTVQEKQIRTIYNSDYSSDNFGGQSSKLEDAIENANRDLEYQQQGGQDEYFEDEQQVQEKEIAYYLGEISVKEIYYDRKNLKQGERKFNFSKNIEQNKSTMTQAGLNLLKSSIGAGILGLPYAFKNCGFILGSFIMLLVGWMVYYSCCQLIEVLDDIGKSNIGFKELFDRVLGKKASNIYKGLLFTMQMGTCIAYVIFFSEFFGIAFQTGDSTGARILYLIIALIPITPMIMINSYHFFHKWSKWALLFTVLTLSAVIIYALSESLTKDHHIGDELAHISGIPSFLGIAIFTFEFIGNIFPVRNSMADPQEFKTLFKINTVIVTSIVLFFSIINVLALEDDINEIILIGLEKKQSFFHLFQCLYALAIMMTYPLQFFPCIYILETNRFIKKQLDSYPRNRSLRYIPRFIATFIIFLIAFFVPRFGVVCNILGAIAGTGMQFYFPILVNQFHFSSQQLTKKKLFINYFILIFATIGAISAIIDTFVELFTSDIPGVT